MTHLTSILLSTDRLVLFLLLFSMCAAFSSLDASQAMYPKTAVGEIEIKRLPASTLVSSRSSRDYFAQDNRLFMPLFRFLKQNDLAMTTPVESQIQPGQMFFHIPDTGPNSELILAEGLELHNFEERLVASIGARGGYSEENFNAAKAKLLHWLEGQTEYRADISQVRGVFWNSPMVPFFLKRFEVHVPVSTLAESPALDL